MPHNQLLLEIAGRIAVMHHGRITEGELAPRLWQDPSVASNAGKWDA